VRRHSTGIHRGDEEAVLMAEKKAKTAEKGGAAVKHSCPKCGAESRVVFYTGFGKRGYFWSCEKACGYLERTR
jgi:ssDNA-binding Zn-finger/Zn-ribbon topoisomerase 1